MNFALRVTRIIDEISRIVGLVAVWLVLFSALLSAAAAVLRYSLGGFIWLDHAHLERGLALPREFIEPVVPIGDARQIVQVHR